MQVSGAHIFVGLSGGVDSAVSALLLQAAGAHVTGVFIKGWYPPGMPCSWAAERRDAMRVAARLHIPFRTLDASEEYKTHVIDYLLREYGAGRTPNPDVMCNKEVKFGAFYRYAKQEGADAIATGHYVSGGKDQRYFLWAVPKNVFAETQFPLRGYEKEVVRALARTHNLPVANKKDSQGVCFLGSISVDDFLIEQFGVTRGNAETESGEVVGEHSGVLLHTLGERIGLTGTTQSGPWYVAAKDIARNVLIVRNTPARATGALATHVRFAEANWHADPADAAYALLRYRGEPVPGSVRADAFKSDGPLYELPVPGQSIVFFDTRHTLVGGGIIAS